MSKRSKGCEGAREGLKRKRTSPHGNLACGSKRENQMRPGGLHHGGLTDSMWAWIPLWEKVFKGFRGVDGKAQFELSRRQMTVS